MLDGGLLELLRSGCGLLRPRRWNDKTALKICMHEFVTADHVESCERFSSHAVAARSEVSFEGNSNAFRHKKQTGTVRRKDFPN